MKAYFARHRVLAFVVGFCLAMATGAVAAITVYTLTTSGTLNNNNPITIVSNNGGDAITWTATGPASGALDTNGTATIPVKLTNNDANGAHSISTYTLTFKDNTQDVACSSHLSAVSLLPSVQGTNIPASGNITSVLTVKLDASAPIICSGTTYTITVAGTTT